MFVGLLPRSALCCVYAQWNNGFLPAQDYLTVLFWETIETPRESEGLWRQCEWDDGLSCWEKILEPLCQFRWHGNPITVGIDGLFLIRLGEGRMAGDGLWHFPSCVLWSSQLAVEQLFMISFMGDQHQSRILSPFPCAIQGPPGLPCLLSDPVLHGD